MPGPRGEHGKPRPSAGLCSPPFMRLLSTVIPARMENPPLPNQATRDGDKPPGNVAPTRPTPKPNLLPSPAGRGNHHQKIHRTPAPDQQSQPHLLSPPPRGVGGGCPWQLSMEGTTPPLHPPALLPIGRALQRGRGTEGTWLAWAPGSITCHLEGRSSRLSPGERAGKAAAPHSRWSGFLWRCRINYNKRWSTAIGDGRSFVSCLPGKARPWESAGLSLPIPRLQLLDLCVQTPKKPL